MRRLGGTRPSVVLVMGATMVFLFPVALDGVLRQELASKAYSVRPSTRASSALESDRFDPFPRATAHGGSGCELAGGESPVSALPLALLLALLSALRGWRLGRSGRASRP
jgi:hypothetical protein